LLANSVDNQRSSFSYRRAKIGLKTLQVANGIQDEQTILSCRRAPVMLSKSWSEIPIAADPKVEKVTRLPAVCR